MAKITAPLQSFTAQGTIAHGLTFSLRQSGQQVRWQRKQKDRITEARTEQRDKFLVAKEMWQLLDYGKIEFGFNLLGGRTISISALPKEQRAPQFARFVSDVINYYL